MAMGDFVLGRWVNANKLHYYVPVKPEYPLATVSTQVAVAEALPVKGVDFLLGNDIAGTWVFPPSLVVSEREGICLCSHAFDDPVGRHGGEAEDCASNSRTKDKITVKGIGGHGCDSGGSLVWESWGRR